jgi:hypothetical protein
MEATMTTVFSNCYSVSALALGAALAATTLVTPAAAATPQVTEISMQKLTSPFDAAPVVHMRLNGDKWVLDKLENAKLRLKVRAKANITFKIVKSDVLLAGKLVDVQAAEYVAREIERTVEIATDPGRLSASIAQSAAWCAANAVPGQIRKTVLMIPVRFEATADQAAGSVPLGAEPETKAAQTSWQGMTVCGPRGRPTGPGGLAEGERPFKALGVSLRFLTTAGYPAQPNPGLRCQVTTVRTRVATSKPGPVQVRLWTKIGGAPASSQLLSAWSKHVGPGKYEAVVERKVEVKKRSLVQAMAEERVNPIGMSTAWKTATVDCTGAGGGGLATKPSGANPDGAAQPFPPKRPKPVVQGAAGEFVGKPRPTHRRTVHRAIAAKEVFDRKKPHVR